MLYGDRKCRINNNNVVILRYNLSITELDEGYIEIVKFAFVRGLLDFPRKLLGEYGFRLKKNVVSVEEISFPLRKLNDKSRFRRVLHVTTIYAPNKRLRNNTDLVKDLQKNALNHILSDESYKIDEKSIIEIYGVVSANG